MLKIKKVKNQIEFENKVAYFKAILMQEAINQLKVNPKIREKIKKEIIKKL